MKSAAAQYALPDRFDSGHLIMTAHRRFRLIPVQQGSPENTLLVIFMIASVCDGVPVK